MKTPHYDYLYDQCMNASSRYKGNYVVTLFNTIFSELPNSRIFKIPQQISEMFLHTTPIKTYLLPYETVFLEQQIKVDEKLSIKGILVNQIPNHLKNELNNPDENLCWCVSNLIVDGKKATVTFLIGETQHDREQTYGEDLQPELGQRHVKYIENIVFNFLCFVNSPDIEYVTKIDTPRDTKIRKRKGKPQRPPIASIILTDPIKRYLSKQRLGEKMVYSHRFWVRGHWRTLRNIKRYGENTGKNIWIKPYIKGDGLLINKNYELRT